MSADPGPSHSPSATGHAGNPGNGASADGPTCPVLAAGARPLPDYELVRKLGKGAFGEVWEAKAPGGFSVALKFVELGEKADRSELRALERMRGIRHAHLLPMFGAWQRSGWLIVAMEMADGSLADRLRAARGQGLEGIPAAELAEYLREAAKGLDFLNERRHSTAEGEVVSIVHKDVKPANLLLVGGSVKVADFGLARLMEHTVSQASGGMTPSYAAPEFLKGQASMWSDQYCLAVTYCHLRGGRLPFEGNVHQVLSGHMLRPPDLTMLPEGERPAVARALAKRPEERWPTCGEFAAAVEAVVRGRIRAGRANALAPETRSRRKKPVTPPLEERTESARSAGDRPAPRRDEEERQPPTSSPSPKRRRGGRRRLRSHGRRDWSRRAVVSGLLAAGCALLGFGMWALLRRLPGAEGLVPGAKNPPPADEVRAANAEAVNPLPREPRRADEGAGNSLGFKFAWCPPGSFLMGSPAGETVRGNDETQHRVTLTKGFFLGVDEVTQAQWQAVMGYNPSKFHGENLPVDTVSWDDCQSFCKKLGERDGKRYRLPTEAEWEYACRAGTTTPFHFGATISTDQANYNGSTPFGGGAKGVYRERTTPVGSFPANAWGLRDLHGNVFEWCADWFAPYGPGDATDPPGAPSGDLRVLRGGSWSSHPFWSRAACRGHETPFCRRGDFGVRVVLCPD